MSVCYVISAEGKRLKKVIRLWSVHRADLQEIMVEAAIKHGAELRLGCPVIAVVENQENATVIIQGYERIKADVVVGADGKQVKDLFITTNSTY